MHIDLFIAVLHVPFGSIHQRFGMFVPGVIWFRVNGYLLNMFKMGICSSVKILTCGDHPMVQGSFVKILTHGDHVAVLESINRSLLSLIWELSPHLCFLRDE